MSRSILRRLMATIIAAVITGALSVTMLSVTATPAQAACSGTLTMNSPSYAKNEWKGYNSISAQASVSDCAGGELRLQRAYPGGSYSTVATGYSYASLSGAGSFNRTAYYRAQYVHGGQVVKTSSTVVVKTIHKVKVKKQTSLRPKFVIKPKSGVKKVIVKAKRGGKWKTVKKTKKAKFRIFVPQRPCKATKRKLIIKGKKGLSKYKNTFKRSGC